MTSVEFSFVAFGLCTSAAERGTGTILFSPLWSSEKQENWARGWWVEGGGREWTEAGGRQKIITNNSNCDLLSVKRCKLSGRRRRRMCFDFTSGEVSVDVPKNRRGWGVQGHKMNLRKKETNVGQHCRVVSGGENIGARRGPFLSEGQLNLWAKDSNYKKKQIQ